MTETELVRAAAARSPQAMSTLYRTHFDPLQRRALAITGCPEDAADAAQDALLATFDRLPQLDPEALHFGGVRDDRGPQSGAQAPPRDRRARSTRPRSRTTARPPRARGAAPARARRDPRTARAPAPRDLPRRLRAAPRDEIATRVRPQRERDRPAPLPRPPQPRIEPKAQAKGSDPLSFGAGHEGQARCRQASATGRRPRGAAVNEMSRRPGRRPSAARGGPRRRS